MNSNCLLERISDYEATGQEEIDLYKLGYLEPLPKYSSEYDIVETVQQQNRNFIFKKATTADVSRIDLKSIAKGTFCQLTIIRKQAILAFDHENFAVTSVVKAKSVFTSPFKKFKIVIPHISPKTKTHTKIHIYIPYVLNECTRITVNKKDTNNKAISKVEYFWVKTSRTSWDLVTTEDNKSNSIIGKYQDSEANACGCIGVIDFLPIKKLSKPVESALSLALCLILFQNCV